MQQELDAGQALNTLSRHAKDALWRFLDGHHGNADPVTLDPDALITVIDGDPSLGLLGPVLI